MVKVKRLLVPLKVGMAFLCLMALAVLKEKVTSSSHSQVLDVEDHVTERDDLAALRLEDDSTLPFSLLKTGNSVTLPPLSGWDSATFSKPQDLAMVSRFESHDPAQSPQFESHYPAKSTQFEPQDTTKSTQFEFPRSEVQASVPSWQPYGGLAPRGNPAMTPGRRELILRPVYPRIVIYNRVPKCASATMLRICGSLSQKNGFTFNNMKVTGSSHKERAQQKKLANWIFNRPLHGRHFFFKHITYLNFSRLGYWEPRWINIVRHPVKRLISHYYFKKPLQTLDVCINTGVCKFERGKERIISQICYFCGYNTQCRSKLTSQTFQMAKQVVEKVFVVVGLQEDLHNTLLVLEHLIPNFFSGASTLNYENWNIQTSKPSTSNRTLAVLERKLKVDLDFYHYLQQRFYKQLEEVKKHTEVLR
ncbi:uronyl 2-sulfotransferase-like [Penaeus indicus]|uniref:uronyl 2-sulfotransferase-like n=1 Tax=Penaeus indicus TaxID=29960 RepID=UPI00300C0A1A